MQATPLLICRPYTPILMNENLQYQADGNQLHSMDKWYPITIENREETKQTTWMYLGDKKFTEPFFETTIYSIPETERRFMVTSTEPLKQFTEQNCLKPSAFFFHSSRCGSTLATQMLSLLPGFISISEASAIDAAVQLCEEDESNIKLLRNTVFSFGQKRFNNESKLFIKLDNWHILTFPIIQKAFPDVPCYFIYREPRKILDSQQRRPAIHTTPGFLAPELLSIDNDTVAVSDRAVYMQQVLHSIFSSAVKHAGNGELKLINYTQLPDYIWSQFLQELSIEVTQSEIEMMKERAKFHSKNSNSRFVEKDIFFEQQYSQLKAIENLYSELEDLRTS